MQIHNVVQGTPEWHALRANHFTASEASAMMGVSTNVLRTELLHMKKTGTEREFSEWAQKNLLDKGHDIEAAARVLAEELIGEELYPITGTSDEHPHLLASFDGQTMSGKVTWECKSWNESKAKEVRDGYVPVCDYWQCVQQLVVSGAEKLLYTITDGTPERTLHVWLMPNHVTRTELLRGWEQFQKDLDSFIPTEVKEKVVAEPVSGLPAITYQLNGLALTSNLAIFRSAAEKAVADSKLTLNTDQDFANREALCKSFSEAEAKIKVIREQVLGEFADVDKFSRELGEIGELLRQARLAGEKQVTARKDQIKLEIRNKAEAELSEYVSQTNKSLNGKVILPRIIDNFTGVMKGKRTLETLQDAVSTELARLKIEINVTAEKITANLAILREKCEGFEFLFRDAQELVQKDSETLSLLIDKRISDFKEIEAERQRKEEEQRLIAEQRAKEKAERDAEELRQREAARIEQADQQAKRMAEVRLMQEAAVVGIEVRPTTEPLPSEPTPMHLEVVDLMALVKAVAQGKAPLNVLNVDLANLTAFCEKQGAPAGVTWSQA